MPRHFSIRVPPIGIPAPEPVLPRSTPLTPLESALPEVASATPLESALTKNVPGHTPFPMASSQFHPDDSIFTIINCLRQPCCPACGFTPFLFRPRRAPRAFRVPFLVFPISASPCLLYSQAGKLLHLRGASCPTLGMTFLPAKMLPVSSS